MRVHVGVDVGVDAHRDVRRRAERKGDVMDAVELRGRLDIEAPDARAQGEGDVGLGLAHAREDDLRGVPARLERAQDLAAAHAVKARAGRGDELEDAAGGGSLDGVADLVGRVAERVFVGADALLDRGARIDIEGRAELAGRVLERDALAAELPFGGAEEAGALGERVRTIKIALVVGHGHSPDCAATEAGAGSPGM